MADSPSGPFLGASRYQYQEDTSSTSISARVHDLSNVAVPPTVDYPKAFNPLRRRFSVSAEPITEVPANSAEAAAVVQAEIVQTHESFIQMTKPEGLNLESLIRKDSLFRALSQDQINSLISTMSRREYAQGSTIIKEGDEGSEMFLIESGECSVFYGQDQVATLRSGQAFGEIALMYNCPRMATITARSPCVVWVLDSKPFKRIIMATSIQKREKHEGFLKQVGLLKHLTCFERAKIADALEAIEFPDKTKIVTQGEENASTFYIVEQGKVHVYKRNPEDPSSREYFVREYGVGDYFGEIALLKSVPRQASCVAVGTVKCLALSREHFFQVMTGVENILRGNIYEDYDELVSRWTAATTAGDPFHLRRETALQ